MQSGLADCCRWYVKDSLRLIRQWLVDWVRSYVSRDPTYDAWRSVDRHGLRCSFEQAWLVVRILAGTYTVWSPAGPVKQRCPWHDAPEWGIDGWKNYRAVMELAGQPDFESRLGPIEVLPDTNRGASTRNSLQ